MVNVQIIVVEVVWCNYISSSVFEGTGGEKIGEKDDR